MSDDVVELLVVCGELTDILCDYETYKNRRPCGSGLKCDSGECICADARRIMAKMWGTYGQQ